MLKDSWHLEKESVTIKKQSLCARDLYSNDFFTSDYNITRFWDFLGDCTGGFVEGRLLAPDMISHKITSVKKHVMVNRKYTYTACCCLVAIYQENPIACSLRHDVFYFVDLQNQTTISDLNLLGFLLRPNSLMKWSPTTRD